MSDDMLEDIIRAYCATKIQREHILNQNGANMVYNHGRDIEKKLGLDAGDANKRLGIQPFPHSESNSNVKINERVGPLAISLIAALAAIAGAGGAVMTSEYLRDRTPETETPIAEPYEPELGSVDIDVR